MTDRNPPTNPAAGTDRRLLNLFDLVLAEVYRQTIRNCGGEIWEANGVVSWASSLHQASPAYANGVMRMSRLMSPREVLGITAQFFRARGHEYTLMVRADDRALWMEIERAGWVMSTEQAALVMAEPPVEVEPREGVEVRRVKDPSGMLDFCAVVTAGLGPDPDIRRLVNLVLRRIQALLGPTKAAFLAYDQGTAAASALSMLIDGVAFIGWICTRSEHRRQGLATAVTTAAVLAGFEQGATMAAVLSPPSALPMLSPMGFEEIGRYREYVFPPPTGPGAASSP